VRQVSSTYLYRFFDANDQLLYVGISKTVLARMAQHFATKDWIPNDGYIKWTTYPTRLSAQEAERQAIINEKPKWNIAFNDDQTDAYHQEDKSVFAHKIIPAWMLEA
jgi:excinuclease UvrABC nuclease subunit